MLISAFWNRLIYYNSYTEMLIIILALLCIITYTMCRLKTQNKASSEAAKTDNLKEKRKLLICKIA